MSVIQLLVSFTALLAIAMVMQPLARKLHLPVGGVLVLTGFGVSELVIHLGVDTGIRWHSFTNLIVYLFLPTLVFTSALRLDIASLRKYMGATLSLSLPLMLVSTFICAIMLYWFVDHATGFPWMAAWLGAALFVATDTLALSEIFERLRARPPITTLLEGEGAFGDAIAVALFSTLITFALSMDDVTVGNVSSSAALMFLWALSAGAAMGWVSSLLLCNTLWPRLKPVARTMTTIVFVYGLYLFVELVLKASGVVSLTIAGMVLGKEYRGGDEEHLDSVAFVFIAWKLLGRIAYLLLFLLVGGTITTAMFAERWKVMLMAIVALLIARIPAILLSLPFQHRYLKHESLSGGQMLVVYFGGVRGAVTLALALSIPVELPYWWTIQSMAYGVVLFSLFVQAPLIEFLLARYRDRL